MDRHDGFRSATARTSAAVVWAHNAGRRDVDAAEAVRAARDDSERQGRWADDPVESPDQQG